MRGMASLPAVESSLGISGERKTIPATGVGECRGVGSGTAHHELPSTACLMRLNVRVSPGLLPSRIAIAANRGIVHRHRRSGQSAIKLSLISSY